MAADGLKGTDTGAVARERDQARATAYNHSHCSCDAALQTYMNRHPTIHHTQHSAECRARVKHNRTWPNRVRSLVTAAVAKLKWHCCQTQHALEASAGPLVCYIIRMISGRHVGSMKLQPHTERHERGVNNAIHIHTVLLVLGQAPAPCYIRNYIRRNTAPSHPVRALH